MMSLMLSVRWLQILAGTVLCLMAGYQIAHNLLAGPQDSGLSLITGLPRLKTGPAVCVLILGLLGIFGFENRYGRLYGRIAGLIGIGVGALVCIQYWGNGGADSDLVFGFSRVVSLFSIGYGSVLLLLPPMGSS